MILALSGEPQKPESQENLNRLRAAGAQVRTAGQADVLTALDDQARAAGANGVLVIAFAGHGVSFDGTQYLLTATSVLRHRETAVSESKIRDIASKSAAGRSLILKSGYRAATTDIDCRRSEPVFIALRPRAGKVQVLLSDTFDDNRNRWHLSTESGAAAELKNGSYFLGSGDGQLTFTTVSPLLDEDADFEISVTVRYVSGPEDSIFGLVWGAAKPGNFWLFAINSRGNISVGAIDINRGGAPVNDIEVVHQAIRTKRSSNGGGPCCVGRPARSRLRRFKIEGSPR